MGQAAGHTLLRMIEQRDPAALKETALSILRQLPIAVKYGRDLFEEIRRELPEKVRAWSELNRALFWHSIAEERMRVMRINGNRLTDHWHASIFGAYWAFDASDFDDMCLQIVERPLTDDKLVALTLAFTLYQQVGRPRAWQARLKKAANEAGVGSGLNKLLRPPKGPNGEFKRQQAAWKRRSEREAANQAAALEKAKQVLASRVATIRHFGKPGEISNDQRFLHEKMRSVDGHHDRWTDGNWRSLIPTFGRGCCARVPAGGARLLAAE
jgi:hypothetical protein